MERAITLTTLCAIFVFSAALAEDLPAQAQEMPSIEITKESRPGLDLRLADLYDAIVMGYGTDGFDYAVPMSADGQLVQVVLEMVSADAPVPQGLGIEVETSYENLVQAMVPIRNLEAIAADENVLMVKLPDKAVPSEASPLVTDVSQDDYGMAYILVGVAGIAAVGGAVVWAKISRR